MRDATRKALVSGSRAIDVPRTPWTDVAKRSDLAAS